MTRGRPIRDREAALTSTQRRLFDAVRERPGISIEELREVMNVGSGSTIFLHIAGLNTRLIPFGICVCGEGNRFQIETRKQRSRQNRLT